MREPRFIQIHTLTSYPGVLLNRDDAGFAKRLTFGGVTRTRVSSQCLKRHWRVFEGEHSLKGLDQPPSFRSRETFQRLVVAPLVKDGLNADLVSAVTIEMMNEVLGLSAKRAQSEEEQEPSVQSAQVTVLGEPEVTYLRGVVRDVITKLDEGATEKEAVKAFKAINKKDLKKNLKGLDLASGLDAALFGRMVTSDILARGDAAIHVAHALTVHAEASESDYFSAVDDLVAASGEGELGSGHINSSELNSGLYYGYVVVDVPLLVSNLTGDPQESWQESDRDLAARVVERIIHLITTVSPGAKLGSTAPYSRAQMLLVESGRAQPRTLANAFLKPVEQRPDLLVNAYDAIATFVEALDGMYGQQTRRNLAGFPSAEERLSPALGVNALSPVSDVAAWAASEVRGDDHD